MEKDEEAIPVLPGLGYSQSQATQTQSLPLLGSTGSQRSVEVSNPPLNLSSSSSQTKIGEVILSSSSNQSQLGRADESNTLEYDVGENNEEPTDKEFDIHELPGLGNSQFLSQKSQSCAARILRYGPR